jgi:hypothetical protein
MANRFLVDQLRNVAALRAAVSAGPPWPAKQGDRSISLRGARILRLHR